MGDDRQNNNPNRTRLVSASELVGLEGTFNVLNDPELVAVTITQLNDGWIQVKTNKGRPLELKDDDSFFLQQKAGFIYYKTGASLLSNPFEKVRAKSVLGQNKFQIYDDGIVSIGESQKAIVYLSRALEGQKVLTLTGKSCDHASGGDFVLVFDPDSHRSVKYIAVRSDAQDEAAAVLEEYLKVMDVLQKPSGVFDFARENMNNSAS